MNREKLDPIFDFDSHAAQQLACLPSKHTLNKTKKILKKIRHAAWTGELYYEYYGYINENVKSQLTQRGFEVWQKSTPCGVTYFYISWSKGAGGWLKPPHTGSLVKKEAN